MTVLKFQYPVVIYAAIYFGLGYAVGRFAGDGSQADATPATNDAAEAAAAESSVSAQTNTQSSIVAVQSAPDPQPVALPAKEAKPAQVVKPVAAAPEAPKVAAVKPVAAPPVAPNKPQSDQIWRVRINSDDAALGPKNAAVTCALFSAFGCATCASMSGTPAKLAKKFGKDLRIVFKHKVIPPSHPDSVEASIASLAAKEQGKFWEYHDKLFAAGPALARPDLIRYAKELGLNLKRFERDLKSGKLRGQVLSDSLSANEVGAHSMPNLLCNGVRMRREKNHESADVLVTQELKKAKKKLAGGVPLANLYASTIKTGKAFEQLGADKYTFDTKTSASIGPAKAKIEVVVFEDFECPYCARVGPPIKSFQALFPKDVRLVFKHLPLTSIHPRAQAASEAAVEAQMQGKFWEYHDLLFANQKALGQPELESYAERVGMDVTKLKQALANTTHKSRVLKDAAEGSRAGVRGTPSVFINGRRYQGPRGYPPEGLEAVSRAYLGL